MGIQTINPYYWVDDHPLLYGNNGSLDSEKCGQHQRMSRCTKPQPQVGGSKHNKVRQRKPQRYNQNELTPIHQCTPAIVVSIVTQCQSQEVKKSEKYSARNRRSPKSGFQK